MGFGDYQNANEEATSNLAGQVEANNPNLAADQAAVGADTTAVGGEVAPWLQQQQNLAVANDQNPASTAAGGATSGAFGSKSAPSAYAGDTQAQADYLQAETGNNGALQGTGWGGVTGVNEGPGGANETSAEYNANKATEQSLAGANMQDASNPYSLNNTQTVASLENNPSQLSGYSQAQQDISKQATDAAQVGNEGSWGGAFGALQSLQTPGTDAQGNSIYNNAAGTGTGFDASLVQGKLSGAADAAGAYANQSAGQTTALQNAISGAAGGVTNPWGAPPAPWEGFPNNPVTPGPPGQPGGQVLNPHAYQNPRDGGAGGWTPPNTRQPLEGQATPAPSTSAPPGGPAAASTSAPPGGPAAARASQYPGRQGFGGTY